jgi:hypothetical protein
MLLLVSQGILVEEHGWACPLEFDTKIKRETDTLPRSYQACMHAVHLLRKQEGCIVVHGLTNEMLDGNYRDI